MSRLPLGETLLKLGLITSSELQSVLVRAAEDKQQKLGEIIVQLGLVDEEGLAKALAFQFNLGFVAAERLLGLEPTAASLSILPRSLMLDGPVLPTFKDPESGAISLLVADPGNEPLLQEIQTRTNAPSLKLYVVPRTPLIELLERSLTNVSVPQEPVAPHEPPEPGPQVDIPEARLAIVLDTNAQRLSSLKQADLEEGTSALYATSTDQVSEHLATGRADRVLYRQEDRARVEEHLEEWKALEPGLHHCVVRGFGPGSHVGVDYAAATDFLLSTMEFLMAASESENLEVRIRIRRTTAIAKRMAQELGLARIEQDTISLAALMLELQEMTLLKGLLADSTTERSAGGRFEAAHALLSPLSCPYPVLELLEVLEDRLLKNTEVSEHPGAEILYTVRTALRKNPNASNLIDAIGAELEHHAANVVEALRLITDPVQLNARRTSDAPLKTVLIAERDPALLTALELRLSQKGFATVLVQDGEAALTRTRELRPEAVIANFRMPRKDGLSLVLDLRNDPILKNIPVVLITNQSSAIDVTRGKELGAYAVLEKPLNIKVLLELLETAIQTPAPQPEA
ncbi:MAG: response regulator [Myxococcota bacterium]|nr:response regulator [Myxococcota bacterium]